MSMIVSFGEIAPTYVSKTVVQKHFPESHKCHKIFRQLKLFIKVSSSCMGNMETIQHQKIVTPTPPLDQPIAGCNYRNKQACPLKNKCLSSCIQNNANFNTSKDTTDKKLHRVNSRHV